jgi:hypothetical protein
VQTVDAFKYNQQYAIFFIALHVSGGFSAHHQEFKICTHNIGYMSSLFASADHDEVQEGVMTWFKGQAADFYDSGIQKLVPRLNKCMHNAGDCVEK